MSKSSQQVQFPAASGEALAARLDLPDGEPVAFALFAHCFTCSKDTRASAYISGALADAGMAVLRFDFTGLGGSEGDFANTNFSSNIDDLVAAADFLREKYKAPSLLVGHSLGGAAVLAAAPRIGEAVAVATINAPADPSHVLHLLKDSVETIQRQGHAEVELAGRRFRITRQFIEDVSERKLTEAIGKLRRALVVFHAPRDTTVSIDNASSIFIAAKHPKSFVSLDDADHLLTRRQDALYVGSVLAAWATRYLGGKAASDAAAVPAVEGVVVEEAGEGSFAQVVRTGRHTLRADEPASAGGSDSGPSPYQLLSAALGACTSMTIRMYADRKNWPLEHVSVHLKHDKIHAKDCEDCETRDGRIDRIEREITITGDLDDTQRQRLLEIADRCPVHRTLHSEVSVRSRLV